MVILNSDKGCIKFKAFSFFWRQSNISVHNGICEHWKQRNIISSKRCKQNFHRIFVQRKRHYVQLQADPIGQIPFGWEVLNFGIVLLVDFIFVCPHLCRVYLPTMPWGKKTTQKADPPPVPKKADPCPPPPKYGQPPGRAHPTRSRMHTCGV